MRTITTTIYKYDELPTDEAKERAREWWIDLETQDPPFTNELRDAVKGATRDMCNNRCFSDLIINLKSVYSWSGSSYDADIIEWMRERISNGEDYIEGWYVESLKEYMYDTFEKEIQMRIEDVNYVEESIMLNEYEFTEDGSLYNN